MTTLTYTMYKGRKSEVVKRLLLKEECQQEITP